MDADLPGAAKEGKWLGANARHMDRCRTRWLRRRNRSPEDQDTPEHRGEHCGACLFWISVAGLLVEEFGVCSSPASPFDRSVRYREDGCDDFVARPPDPGPQVGDE